MAEDGKPVVPFRGMCTAGAFYFVSKEADWCSATFFFERDTAWMRKNRSA